MLFQQALLFVHVARDLLQLSVIFKFNRREQLSYQIGDHSARDLIQDLLNSLLLNFLQAFSVFGSLLCLACQLSLQAIVFQTDLRKKLVD